jgi:putative heme-binding domain-containing protein
MRKSAFLQLCFGLPFILPLVAYTKETTEDDGERRPMATSAESLTVIPGFKAELLRSAQKGEGSWICMTVDAKGRLIISPQDDKDPLLRFTLSQAGQVTKVERILAPVHQAMGLLYAHDSLYVNGHGPQGTGLYRLIDANHNDMFEADEVHFLKHFAGEGEHGYHAVVLGPDKMIYVMNGNHTKLPEGLAEDSPHKNFHEELLLPRQWDAGGHAVGILAPGGHVLRTDPDGKRWELMLAGFRNAYDFAFSPEGEMFTFDSDMEWDWGLPWYRPTRIIHCVRSGEYGWRSGSAKWPEYYADSLPPVVNIGIGSPTGVQFGTRSNFPERYRSALFALDWSYGRIFAVHLKPDGASYTGQYEVFLHGQPLNLTHLEFGRDGAMYFITGGRGTQSGLYRVSYIGGKATPPEKTGKADRLATKQQHLRHELEAFHGKKDPRAIGLAWPCLNSEDRFIRYVARIAVEWQDPVSWKDRALSETNVNAGLTALLALARCGGKETQADLLHALEKFSFDSLSLTQRLDKLRILELSLIRQGKPEPGLVGQLTAELGELYPADNEFLNRELSQLLIYLEAPDVISKTLALLDKAKTQEEQAHYIFYLRAAKIGWTLDQRKRYFDWFRFAQRAAEGKPVAAPRDSAANPQPDVSTSYARIFAASTNERHPAQLIRWFKEADRDYSDGASYPKYLVNIRNDAVATLSEADQVALSSWILDYTAAAAFKPQKERHLIKEWKMADLEPSLGRISEGRSFASGKAAFHDGQCILCHRFQNTGGSVGPELTAVSSKYTRRDILESILEPSKVVSEQYQNFTIIKTDGESETGRIVDENDEEVVIQPSPLIPDRTVIKKPTIRERRPSKVSPMPEGLVNQMTDEEILDLIAYLTAGGKPDAECFRAAGQQKH